jgi:hypothetical protein
VRIRRAIKNVFSQENAIIISAKKVVFILKNTIIISAKKLVFSQEKAKKISNKKLANWSKIRTKTIVFMRFEEPYKKGLISPNKK